MQLIFSSGVVQFLGGGAIPRGVALRGAEPTNRWLSTFPGCVELLECKALVMLRERSPRVLYAVMAQEDVNPPKDEAVERGLVVHQDLHKSRLFVGLSGFDTPDVCVMHPIFFKLLLHLVGGNVEVRTCDHAGEAWLARFVLADVWLPLYDTHFKPGISSV